MSNPLFARPQAEILQEPLPMAVFGTLRRGNYNNRLMYGYHKVERAYLPNFKAQGLSLAYSPGSSCPFEVFHYTPLQWKMMIPLVDSLESFHPVTGPRGCYTRTVAMLRILPDSFQHHLFDEPNNYGDRSLGIPPGQIVSDLTATSIPCWVYSSDRENARAIGTQGNPILWSGDFSTRS